MPRLTEMIEKLYSHQKGMMILVNIYVQKENIQYKKFVDFNGLPKIIHQFVAINLSGIAS